jgi:hypothetical protein
MKTNKRQILIEGRVEDLKAKYVDNPNLEPIKKIGGSVFNKLVKGDPSGNQKYLEWMIKVMIRGYSLGIGSNYVMGLVKEFHENQQRLPKKDLYQYSGYNELGDALKNLQPSKSDMKKIQKEGSIKLYEDEQYLIVAPTSELGSCYYGQGTRWCTSAKRQNAFDTYNEDGTLIYIINKLGDSEREDNDGFSRDYSKIAMFIDFSIYKQGMKHLNSPNIELFDATDTNISEDALWSDFVFDASVEDKLKMQDAMVKYFVADWNERAPMKWDDDEDDTQPPFTEGLENLIYIKGLLNEINESDLDWVSEVPSEDDNVVYLEFGVGTPDPDDEDGGEWTYWSLWMYMSKTDYTKITGSDTYDIDSSWDEWNIHDGDDIGLEILNYFYHKGFYNKQPHGLSTEVRIGWEDGSFVVTNRTRFCKHVGNYHPEMCGLSK